MTIQKGDRFVAFPGRRPAERLFLQVTRVAKDRTWADITVQTWAVQWRKRQDLQDGIPPMSVPYNWTRYDLDLQQEDHMKKLEEAP